MPTYQYPQSKVIILQIQKIGCVNLFLFIFYLFYLYIYPPDLQESNGGANTLGRQLPQPASGDAKILLFACSLIEI